MASIKKIIQGLIILLVMLFFTHISNEINRDAIWFRNMDQDSMNLIGALDVNAGNTPTFNEHPGLGTFFIYGKAYEMLSFFDLIAISSLKDLETHLDPIVTLPSIYLTGRKISISISILCSLIFSFIVYLQFKNYPLFLMAFCSMLFSKGILFQSLVIRNELISLLFFLLSLLLCQLGTKKNYIFFYFLSGLFSCFAYFTKIQILPFLLLNVLLILAAPILNKKQPANSSKMVVAGCFILASYIYLDLNEYNTVYLSLCLYINLALCIVNLYFHFFIKNASLKVATIGISVFLSAFLFGIILIRIFFYQSPEFPNRFLFVLQNSFFESNSMALKHISLDFGSLIKQNPFSSIFDTYKTNLLLIFSLTSLGYIVLKDKLQAIKGIGLLIAFILVFVLNLLRKSKSVMFLKVTYLCYTDFFLLCLFIFCAFYLLKKQKHMGIVLLLIIIITNSIITIRDISNYYPTHNKTFANAYQAIGTCIYKVPNFEKLMLQKYNNHAAIEQRVINDSRLNGSTRGIDIQKVIAFRKKYQKKRK